MWFSNFSTKKSNFIKKVNVSIDNDLQYFSPKNHFLYWKNGFQKILEVKKKFSQQHESVVKLTPPLSCCWENVKKCQNFTYGYFVKNSKNTIINRETVFTKIFEKTHTYGDSGENFQKCAGRLRVKGHLCLLSINIPWCDHSGKVSSFRPVCHLTPNAFVRSIHNQSLLLTRNCGFA